MSSSLSTCLYPCPMPRAWCSCNELVRHSISAIVRTCEHCEAGATRQPGQQRVEGERGRHRDIEELHRQRGDSAYVSRLVQRRHINKRVLTGMA